MNEINQLKSNEAIRLGKETTDVDVIIALSKHRDGLVRQKSLIQLCPCRVREDIDKFWSRVLEMVTDEEARVRAQVLHTLCDGSPKHMENEVLQAMQVFNSDPDSHIRRTAHKVLATYSKSGKWNIL